MDTHAAIVTVAPRASLELHHVPSPKPTGNEVRVRNEWTTSGPLDLHKADGGLLVKHPEVLGGGVSGTVVEVGDEVRKLKIGDKVCIPDRSEQVQVVKDCTGGTERRYADACGDHNRSSATASENRKKRPTSSSPSCLNFS